MPGASYSASNKVSSGATSRGMFGDIYNGGLSFGGEALDTLPPSAFFSGGGAGGTASRTALYVGGAVAVAAIGLIAVMLWKKK